MHLIGEDQESLEVKEDGINMSKAYEITHCIWCGRTGFKDSDEVINHIKETHTRAA